MSPDDVLAPLDALQVAIDLAVERDEFPIGLREQVARVLPHLRIASPWTPTTEDGGGYVRIDCGGSGVLTEPRSVTQGSIRWAADHAGAWTAWTDGMGSEPIHHTEAAARQAADGKLRANGWVLCEEVRRGR